MAIRFIRRRWAGLRPLPKFAPLGARGKWIRKFGSVLEFRDFARPVFGDFHRRQPQTIERWRFAAKAGDYGLTPCMARGCSSALEMLNPNSKHQGFIEFMNERVQNGRKRRNSRNRNLPNPIGPSARWSGSARPQREEPNAQLRRRRHPDRCPPQHLGVNLRSMFTAMPAEPASQSPIPPEGESCKSLVPQQRAIQRWE